MRRTPITRRAPLTAKTELKRTTALARAPLARSALHADPAAKRQTARRSPNSPIPAKVRVALKLRSGGLCEIQAPGCLEVATDDSHRIKTGMGGRKGHAAVRHRVLSNLLHACRHCHREWLHREPKAAYAQGWMLREHQNPLTEPVVYRGHWHLLADDGSIEPIHPTQEEPVSNYVQEVESRLKALTTMPLSDSQARVYALLVLTRGAETTLQDVHDAWAVDRNVDRPDHQDIVPFEQLDPKTAEWDRPFQVLIHQVAGELAPTGVA